MHHKRLMMSIDLFAQLPIGARKLAIFLSSFTPTALTHRAWSGINSEHEQRVLHSLQFLSRTCGWHLLSQRQPAHFAFFSSLAIIREVATTKMRLSTKIGRA